MKAKYFFFLVALLYTGAITYLSLINLAQTPVKDLGMSDKAMHGGAYFGLALLWIIAIFFNSEKGFGKKITFICLASIVYGTLIEVLQTALTSYRELDQYDMLANSIGVLLAGLLVWALQESLIRLKVKINSFFIKK